jgi:hypothetical protein
MQAMQLRLPEIVQRLRAVEKRLRELDSQTEKTADDDTDNR